MKKQNKQNGITLIALVITIIILIILAGISISALSGSGLFERAQQAKQESENAQANEDATLAEYDQWMTNYTGGSRTEITPEPIVDKVQPGDYVTYTPDTASTTDILSELSTYSGSTKNTETTLTQEIGLKWRVLDVTEDGKVRLISEVPTTSRVTLYGYNGFNNAVYLLDKTCKTLYSKAGYSENVQSLKIEDIQKYMTIIDYRTMNSKYGTTLSPTKKNYPSILAQLAGQTVDGETGTLGLSEQTTPINQTAVNTAKELTVKFTHWHKSMAESDFTNPIYYNLFINNGSPYSIYWMSSRNVSGDVNEVGFGIRCVESGRVDSITICTVSGYYDGIFKQALRPVVTLNSNVLVTTGDGTSDSPYGISL